MVLISILLIIALVAIGVYMYNSYNTNLRMTLEQVVKPFNPSFANRGKSDFDDEEFGDKAKFPRKDRTDDFDFDIGEPRKLIKIDEDVTTVMYSESKNKISIIASSETVDRDIVDEAVAEGVRQKDSYGKLADYNLIYYKEKIDTDYKFAFISASFLFKSMLELSLILFFIFVVLIVVFFFVSYHLSKIAIKPLNRALDMEKQFVADISHDLKTPLTVVLANNNILNENPDSTVAEQKQWIDSTETAARNMMSMVNEMLTLSALDGSIAVVEKSRVNFSSALTKSVLQMESVAYDRGVGIETDIAENIFINSNDEYIQRICTSLIDNAIKYEPSGGRIHISLTARRKEAVMRIQNFGAVIPQEDLPHIFERFYRGDKSRSDKSGHGLGLSIAKKMIMLAGGKIKAESGSEIGTVFTLKFKLID